MKLIRKALRLTFAALFLIIVIFAAQTNAAENKNSLWKVKGIKNTVYLMGSIHMLKAENYPLSSPIEEAFADSKILVLEVDMGSVNDPKTQGMMIAKGKLPEGDSLDKHLSKETYEQVKAKVEPMGINMVLFNQFKPWFFAMTVTALKLQWIGFNPQYGLDMHFFERAKATGKKIVALETLEEQLDMLDGLSSKTQDQFVLQTFSEMEMLEIYMSMLVKAWSTGNVTALEGFLLQSFNQFPEMREVLLTDRNEKWVREIDSYLKQDKNYMVVVGAAHLVGKNGVVSLLEKKGYSVEQQ